MIKRDDDKPIEGRKYCKKHGSDITILPCDFCGDDISEFMKRREESKKDE